MGESLLPELTAAGDRGAALAAVNVYDAHQAWAVADAAHAEDRPAVLQISGSSLSARGGEALSAAVLAVRDATDAHVGVHLDHAREPEQILRALDAGFDSVMIDASHLPLRENIERTRRIVDSARPYGAWVEAELGAVAGEEDSSSLVTRAAPMTDPAEAGTFVLETGIDALAIAIGNVHGMARDEVAISFQRLSEIRHTTAVPLVMHGSSGLPEDILTRAIRGGICKINVNTEVRRAYLAALHGALDRSDSDDLTAHFAAARRAAQQVVQSKISLFAASVPARDEGVPR